MSSIWIVHLKVLAFVDEAPAKGKLGFINVVVSADAAKDATLKVVEALNSYGWQILIVGSVVLADPDQLYKEDLNELIEDVAANPRAVRLSTLHCYKAN
jgi:hypothetical protein